MNLFDKVLTIDSDVEAVVGLTKQLQGIYLYKMFKETEKSILYVTSTLYEANQMFQILSDLTEDALLFPMDDFLTSEALATSPEFVVTRLETLNTLLNNKRKIVVTNLMGYLRFLPLKKSYQNSLISLTKNQDYNFKNLVEKLYNLGYKKETIVTKTGEMAVRGFVIDIFPLNKSNAIRIEFWGDTIDSIRFFDIESQRTKEEIDNVLIYPNTEFILDDVKHVDSNKQRDLIKYGKTSNISEYMSNPIVFYSNYSEIKNSYAQLVEDMSSYTQELGLDSSTKYMNLLDDIHENRTIYIQNDDTLIENVKKTQRYLSHEIQGFNKNLENFVREINKNLKDNKTIVFCLKNRYQIQKIEDLFDSKDIVITNLNDIYENKINLVIQNIESGFVINQYLIIGEKDVFGQSSHGVKYKTNFQYGSKVKDITKLNVGDYIVHFIHGIGRYMGLKTLTKNGVKKDYLTIEYKGGDKLYIPVEKIDLISKYSSNESIVPKINKLGSTEWEKTKLKVKKKLEDIAGKLLKLYALREASTGISFDKDVEEQAIFESSFPYQETKDQLRVMEEIKKDMESKKPMDRLVCGDVGYGKTELAFRAMFKAVMSGYQAAYLCPTTILSDQHYRNALVRFRDFPIHIKILNRFVSPKEVKKTIEGLKDGSVDIVIGTHRLLSDDIVFKNLGLLVVDEEQRFGVKHKEKIKELKNNIDILTLSATPIPRTLQMSMTGIRSLSLLETPPTNRYPVQTYVLEENKAIIKDALYKELSRNGQAFILYNYVEDMEQKRLEISRLVPEARIICAHGQMSKTELEDVMQKFIMKEYDVLLCTTIIETGIDIPNVNTLLIMDADHFGLSQLYQIRGRVGRSDKIAYCYLMYTPGKSLSDVANKRLQVIKEFTELGSGFSIAMRDLSIRGAGDILGQEQAGYVDSVGIELYLKMLNEQVAILSGKKLKEEEISDEQPLVDVETTIDDSYVNDTDIKIEIHQKINAIDSYEKLLCVKEELEDRFGKLSENIIIYMHEEWFEKLAHNLGIKQIKQTNNFIEITVPSQVVEQLDGQKLFMDVISKSRMFRFGYRGKNLLITLDIVKLDKHFIYYLIDLMNIIEQAKN